MKIDDRIVKVKVDKTKRDDGLSVYPWSFLKNTPPLFCAFDSYRGTIGFDVFPFAITTRVSASSEVFIKVYESVDDSDEREGTRGDGIESRR